MGQRLLIVDSDRAFLKEQQVSLEAAYEIEVASSPDGIIPKLGSGAYAAVLICVEVSDNKGYALCTAIRKNAALADVKVALISAKATEEEYRRHQSLKGRADLYLQKPIAPSALVASLNPFVPMRSVDPDNPLGDLADSDLGEDWLDGLKSDIASEMERPAAPEPPSNQTMAIPMAPTSQDNAKLAMSEGKMAALEAQVSGFESVVKAKNAELLRLQTEFDHLRHSHDSVTQNMEDLERRQAESEALKQRLADTEAALKKLEETPKGENADSLKTQLRGAMGERTELLLQVEALNNQMAEKTTRIMTLMKEKDHLQQQSLDDQTKLEGMTAVEASLGSIRSELATAQETLATKATEHDLLSATHAELKSKHQVTLETLAEIESKLKMAASEVPALEITIRGQGRELVELGNRIATKDKEIESLNAKATDLEAELQIGRDEMKAKDDKIEALKATVASVQQVQETLERDKQVLQGQLAERQERLQSLATLLAESADKLRKGADLAQG